MKVRGKMGSVVAEKVECESDEVRLSVGLQTGDYLDLGLV